jgi:DNA-directed RNA polymerase specialized sigma24 family protein
VDDFSQTRALTSPLDCGAVCGERTRLRPRHQALARATLRHDDASSTLQAAGYSLKSRPPEYWLRAYYESVAAEEVDPALVTVPLQTLIGLDGVDASNPQMIAETACLQRALSKALLSLTPCEERILRLIFFCGQSSGQVAEALGASGESIRKATNRIRQIGAKALRKLRRPSQARELRLHLPDGLEAERRSLKRRMETWTPRGLAAQAASYQADVPTWAKFRLVAVNAPEAPRGLAAAIPRLGGIWTKADFEQLTMLLAEGGAGAKALHHARTITPTFTLALATLPAPLREGCIVALLNTNQAVLVARTVQRIGADTKPEIMHRLRERLSRARSTARLFQMLVAEIGVQPSRSVPALAAPWLLHLSSAQELERAARKFRNCLRMHVPRLLAGDDVYFEVLDPAPAIVQIVRTGGGPWSLGQVSGPGNKRVDQALHARLHDHLSAHRVSVRPPEEDLAVLILREARMG